MVWIRYPDPKVGDQHLEMEPQQVMDFLEENSSKFKLGVWETADESMNLEAEMMNKTNLLEALEQRANDTLRLQPVIAGG